MIQLTKCIPVPESIYASVMSILQHLMHVLVILSKYCKYLFLQKQISVKKHINIKRESVTADIKYTRMKTRLQKRLFLLQDIDNS